MCMAGMNIRLSIDNEPIEEDWTNRFFRIVEDISNEEMQALWGKILAGEIKQPRTYSLRTLERIRNLTKDEAEIFTKIANFAIKSGKENYLLNGDKSILNKKFKIKFEDLEKLIDAGLVQSDNEINIFLTPKLDNSASVFTSGSIVFMVYLKANTSQINIPVNKFTSTGNELLKLIRFFA